MNYRWLGFGTVALVLAGVASAIAWTTVRSESLTYLHGADYAQMRGKPAPDFTLRTTRGNLRPP